MSEPENPADHSRRRCAIIAKGMLALAILALTACSSVRSTVTWTGEDGQVGDRVQAIFKGNENVSRFSLFRKIEDLLYDYSKDPGKESAIFDAALALEDFYHAQGFPRAKVSYEISPTKNEGSQQILFQIEEGGLVVIDELEIRGNHSIQDDELLKLLPQISSNALGFGRPIFVEATIQGFAKDIRTRFAQDGYLSCSVAAPQITYIEEGKAVRVLIQVREGPIFTLRKVEIAPDLLKAAEGWTPEKLAGEPFGRKRTSQLQIGLRQALRRHGYPKPKVLALAKPVTKAKRQNQVDLFVTGETGPRTVISKIAIEGNKKTRDWVIRNRIVLEEGKLFDGELEDESLRQLYRTGLFKKISVRYEALADEGYRAVFVFEELSSQEIQLHMGYGSYEQLRLGARFEEKNLFGTGLDFSWSGKASFKDVRTGISFVDSQFLAEELQLSFGGEWFRRHEPSYVDSGYRFNIGLDQEFYPHLRGRLGYRFVSHQGAKVDAPEIDPSLADYSKGEIFADLFWDQRDHPIVTRQGRSLTARISYAHKDLGGDIEFFRLSGKAVQYFPFTRNTRFVARYETTALFPQDGSDRIPLQEHVFSGGSTTVRSYAYNELGTKSVTGDPLGGEFRQVLSGELRFPLPFPLPLLGPTEAAAFVDAGNIGSDIRDWGFEDMKYAIGFGLRYSLPFILRFDAGWNPDRDAGDSAWAFHLTIGTPF